MWTSVEDQADLFDKVSVTGLFGQAVIFCQYSTMQLVGHGNEKSL